MGECSCMRACMNALVYAHGQQHTAQLPLHAAVRYSSTAVCISTAVPGTREYRTFYYSVFEYYSCSREYYRARTRYYSCSIQIKYYFRKYLGIHTIYSTINLDSSIHMFSHERLCVCTPVYTQL